MPRFPSLWPLALQFLGAELVPSAEGELTGQRLWAACPPDVPPEPPVSGRLQVQHIRVTQRKENSTSGRSSRYVPEHPPLLAAPCAYARSVCCNPRSDSSRWCGVKVRPFVKKAFPVIARVTGVSSALALRYRGRGRHLCAA